MYAHTILVHFFIFVEAGLHPAKHSRYVVVYQAGCSWGGVYLEHLEVVFQKIGLKKGLAD